MCSEEILQSVDLTVPLLSWSHSLHLVRRGESYWVYQRDEEKDYFKPLMDFRGKQNALRSLWELVVDRCECGCFLSMDGLHDFLEFKENESFIKQRHMNGVYTCYSRYSNS